MGLDIHTAKAQGWHCEAGLILGDILVKPLIYSTTVLYDKKEQHKEQS